MTKLSINKYDSKMFVKFILTGLILTLGILFITTSNVQAQNDWYVGKGVEKDMYVKYGIQYFDTNNGRPFDMTIYFKDQDEKGNWIAPVFVEDQGKVINGTFILSSLDLTALGTSDIPPEMRKYRSAYANSLQWLAAYVPKPGQSLNSASWGKIGAIGGAEIKPVGQAQLNIPAFSQPIDTTRIEYYKSVSSNIYIKSDFPYPVMAKTYVDITTGNPPIQFQFILTETGKGQPTLPEGQEFQVTPPLMERTERGEYYVQLDWSPVPIVSGTETTFTIDFLDKDKFTTHTVSYNMKIIDSNDTAILDLKNQFTRTESDTQKFTFENPGRVTVEIEINSVKGVGTGAFIEKADFALKVD